MTASAATRRVLVVEDEYLIRMLLEDMLDELGYGVAAAVGTISEARQFATDGEFNAAILDVNLDGQEIYPVADILAGAWLALRFRHRVWRTQPAGGLSRPPCSSETISGRATQDHARRIDGLA